MALAVGCRPNFVLGSIIIAPIVLNGLATNGGYNRINKVGKTSGNEHKKCNYFKAIFSKKNIKNLYRKIPACPKIFQQKIRQKYYCFFSKTHTGDFLRAGMSIA